MNLFTLALKSLAIRKTTVSLTIVSLTLSFILLFTVDRLRREAEVGFTQAISQTDLIIGGRTGSVQLLLYTIFNVGTAGHGIDLSSYERIKSMPSVKWAVPMAMGDSHRGFRVVGTTTDYFANFKYRQDQALAFHEGLSFSKGNEIVIGWDVAKKLNYELNDEIIITHGVTKGEGVLKHDDKPFVIKGILAATGTPVDQSVFVSLEGHSALHHEGLDEKGQTDHEDQSNHDDHDDGEPKVGGGEKLNAILLGLNSKMDLLRIQREINEDKVDPMMAIIPGVVAAELWQNLGHIETILTGISYLVLIVGLMSLVVSLLTSLNERRREMAILRAIGVSAHKIRILFLTEALAMVVVSILTSIAGSFLLMWVGSGWVVNQFGVYFTSSWLGTEDLVKVCLVLLVGIGAALIPAQRAMRMSLKDGLSQKI